MTLSAAYGDGKHAAAAAFGIRTAADVGRMPDGPKHLGASKFVAALEGHAVPGKAAPGKRNPLDRDAIWGQPSSPESGGMSNGDQSLRFGGV